MFVDSTRKYIYPSPLLRLSAFVLDSFLLITPIALLWGVVFGFDELKSQDPKPVLLLIEALFFWIVTCVGITKKAQTPGKKALGLYVIHAKTFEKISFPRACFRFFLWILCWLTLGIGFFIAFFDKRRQTLVDKLSTTVVVRDIGPKSAL